MNHQIIHYSLQITVGTSPWSTLIHQLRCRTIWDEQTFLAYSKAWTFVLQQHKIHAWKKFWMCCILSVHSDSLWCAKDWPWCFRNDRGYIVLENAHVFDTFIEECFLQNFLIFEKDCKGQEVLMPYSNSPKLGRWHLCNISLYFYKKS